MEEKEEAAERGAQRNAFIGRPRELSELRAALEGSIAGRGAVYSRSRLGARSFVVAFVSHIAAFIRCRFLASSIS